MRKLKYPNPFYTFEDFSLNQYYIYIPKELLKEKHIKLPSPPFSGQSHILKYAFEKYFTLNVNLRDFNYREIAGCNYRDSSCNGIYYRYGLIIKGTLVHDIPSFMILDKFQFMLKIMEENEKVKIS